MASAALLGRAGAQEHQHPPSQPTASEAAATPLYDNLGSLERRITTSSPTAQQYFDQGLRLIYAFNHDEAIKSFKEGLKQDSTCAMCYWGIAYALGPNINLPMDTASVRRPGRPPRQRSSTPPVRRPRSGPTSRRLPSAIQRPRRPIVPPSIPPGPRPSALVALRLSQGR